ncbi:hypothetical protein NX059_009313 [Plenodomus lindquistii]|nr:hypothetical protein NX059_009313 [Plenodomus lindquistii]
MTPGFLNYPTPKAHETPFEAPPEGQNPVFKGKPLDILSYAYVLVIVKQTLN